MSNLVHVGGHELVPSLSHALDATDQIELPNCGGLPRSLVLESLEGGLSQRVLILCLRPVVTATSAHSLPQ